MPSKKIIVTGSNGQLGSELKDLASSFPQYEFVFLTRAEYAVDDKKAGEEIFHTHRPAYFINCAAYTAVDKAESEQEAANEINANAVGHIAFLASKYKTRLIHISTDYVFNGLHQAPIRETEEVDPVNTYGSSKLMGEYLALRNDPEVLIIRTSWVYSSYGRNFVRTMLRLMKEKDSVNVVNDQFGSPTYAGDLAKAIMAIVHSGKWLPGIYHYCNAGAISWYDFALAIKELSGSSCQVHPITTEQYPTPAKRPAYSVLDTSKIRSDYGIIPPPWKESLRTCMEKLQGVS